MNRFARAILLVAVAALPAAAAGREATIYFSHAPWDGAAYELRIPLSIAADAPNPVVRVNLWGNPEFAKSETVRFTGKEDASGGPGAGRGRASYQTVLDRSLPEPLTGAITFRALTQGRPVEGTYKLKLKSGRELRGKFRAAWGNEKPRGRVP